MHSSPGRRWGGVCFWALVMASGFAALPSIAASPFSKDPPAGLIVDENNNIYDNQKAFDLVMEAHKFDPMFSAEANRDRDRAVELYRQAIAAQPGAKGNAPLANRIAQMYATYIDPAAKISPNPELAKAWWLQCLEFTDDRQILWVEAQNGLISLGLIGRDRVSVQERCEKILAVDPLKMGLPLFKDWSRTNPEEIAAVLQRQREGLSRMQKTSAERLDAIRKAANEPAAPARAAAKPATTLPATTAPAATRPAVTEPK